MSIIMCPSIEHKWPYSISDILFDAILDDILQFDDEIMKDVSWDGNPVRRKVSHFVVFYIRRR